MLQPRSATDRWEQTLLFCPPIHFWLARLSRNHHELAIKAAMPIVEGTLPTDRVSMGFVLMVSGFALLGFINAAPDPYAADPGGFRVGQRQRSRWHLVRSSTGRQPIVQPHERKQTATTEFGDHFDGPDVVSDSHPIMERQLVNGGVGIHCHFWHWKRLSSIAQGTLPLAPFGNMGYGERVGQSTAVRLVASSGAPFVFAFIMHWLGIFGPSLLICVAVGCLAAASFAHIRRQLRIRSKETV